VDPLVLHDAVAETIFRVALLAWAAAELVLRIRSRRRESSIDWSFVVVVAAVSAGLVLGFAAADDSSAIVGGGWIPVVVGLLLVVAGVAFRLWAMATLGRLFTYQVSIQPGHTIVESGPYRVLRHPSYTGALVALLGVGICLDNWLSVLALVVVPLLGILVRIRVEEARLTAALGNEYRDYAARTRRLLPGVW
jgi:protein-S-isoprenylcysteine O-methyltransferase Ste14